MKYSTFKAINFGFYEGSQETLHAWQNLLSLSDNNVIFYFIMRSLFVD